ncbi:hypothetical protein [Sorangium sp. So ce1151]|uniref:hypothetical protein n=1 Tax=Sorangium sp. So ce1151 TaxID=3133332 RepID=UPI003F5D7B3C
MRRYVMLAAAVAPILAVTAAVSVPGCGEEFENICAFVNEPNSCYHAFQAETAAECWTPGTGEGPSGSFSSRETLDVCFLDEGGQIVFDPPLDIAAFPPKTMAFKRLTDQAEECGAGTFSGEFSYSVTVAVPCSPDDIDAGVTECADAGADGIGKVGKTLTLTTPEGRSTLDVSCADGTSHHFNRIDIQECAEEGQDQLQPRAVLEASVGNQPPPDADPITTTSDNFRGFVKLSILYPQSRAIVKNEENKKVVMSPPEVVEYFNCYIPAPAPLCFNGEKDGLETDIDCGGTLCSTQCDVGQSCARPTDCTSNICMQDTSGFLKCQASTSSASATTGSGAGAGGSGGADGSGGAGGE